MAVEITKEDQERARGNWKHVKSGRTYTVLELVPFSCSVRRELDDAVMVIYCDKLTGQKYTRLMGEFFDGRFVKKDAI
jgi:hypothetical protein